MEKWIGKFSCGIKLVVYCVFEDLVLNFFIGKESIFVDGLMEIFKLGDVRGSYYGLLDFYVCFFV